MSGQIDKTNRGSIWKNEKKELDTHPDFTGSLNVGGIEYWVSAWKRKPDANPKAPALSFSVKPKDPVAKPYEDTAKTVERFKDTTRKAFDIDDSIPF